MITRGENRRQRRWWLPGVGVVLWLTIFLTLNLSQWRYALINVDGDSCLHWRMGDWMIRHRAIIRSDPFSHTRWGAPVIAMEWLSQVLYAAAGNALGWNGIVLLAAALITTSLWLLYQLLLAEGNNALLSLVLVLLAAWGTSLHWLARPHLWTLVLIVIFLWQLRAFDCGRVSAKRLFMVLPPLSAVWANLHGGFFGGLVLIAAFWIGSAVAALRGRDADRIQEYSKMRALTLLGGACLLATFLNPNGWKLHAYILSILRHHEVVALSSEFRSPDFHGFWMRGFLAQALVFGLLLIIARPRLRPSDVVVTSIWGCASLYSVRHASILALVLTPILAEHWTASIHTAPEGVFPRLGRRLSEAVGQWDAIADGRALAVGCVAMLVASAARPQWFGGSPIVTAGILPNCFPVAAVEFLHAHPDAIRGEMFNDRRWGGYLVLAAPEWRVFMDGRTDFYGGNLIKDFRTVDKAEPQWEGVFRVHHIGWTILPRDHALNTLLGLRADWRLAYADRVAAVYTRQEIAHGGP
ncbi:MAG TPA: hypothetical protein VL486_01340 [Verrucomicrobiae bacterium]|nr:hypothetical protein [Verrucomicrobiae bacterium]